MTMSTLPPDLARAAELLQAGQRETAGRLLKAYLTANPRDAEGWWLMSQAVSQPENVRTCLERALRLRPDDARVRARLAQLDLPQEPDDSFFQFDTPPAPSAAPVTTHAPTRSAPVYSTGASASFDPTLDLGVTFDPFAGIESEGDPFAALRGQQPGTGHQPQWGPGLGFVSEKAPSAPAPARPARRSAPSSTLIGVLVVIFALIALGSVLALAAKQRGWLKGSLPEMETLDAGSFSIEYPEAWGGLCKADAQGNPVCGIANDPRYNGVDFYTGAQADTAQMFTSAIGGLFSYEQAPGLMVSVIAMDVPETSQLYMRESQAKMVYEMAVEYPTLVGGDYELDYEESAPVIDGRAARVYRVTMEDTSGALESFVIGGGDAAHYDVYIPHDGKMFWMMVQVYDWSDREEIPRDVIEHMIDSIDLKTS